MDQCPLGLLSDSSCHEIDLSLPVLLRALKVDVSIDDTSGAIPCGNACSWMYGRETQAEPSNSYEKTSIPHLAHDGRQRLPDRTGAVRRASGPESRRGIADSLRQ